MGIDTSDILRFAFAATLFGLGLTIGQLNAPSWIKWIWFVVVAFIFHQIDWLVVAFISGFAVGYARWWYAVHLRRPTHRHPRAGQSTHQSSASEERDALQRERIALERERVLLDGDRARLAGVERQLRDERRRFEEVVAQRDDPHAVLGLKPGASRQEIIRRYRQLAVRYHPDKAAQASPAIQKLAEREFVRIKAAYEGLVRER